MQKALLILICICTFIIVGIIHVVSMKLMNLPQAKKAKYGTFFWYFYGIILMLSGVVNLLEQDTISWNFIVELILGLIILILNALGKLNNKTA